MPICRVCSCEKPTTEFERIGNGYRRLCKLCRLAQMKAYRDQHKDRLYANARKWVEDHKVETAAYHAEYRSANRDKLRNQNRELYAENGRIYNANRKAKYNSEKAAESNRRNYTKHRDKRISAMRNYEIRNPHIIIKRQVKRRTSMKNSVVAWNAEWNDFVTQEAGILRRLRNKATGVMWEVDHVIPLNSKVVCGLHVAENLAVIPKYVNRSKHNRYDPINEVTNGTFY